MNYIKLKHLIRKHIEPIRTNGLTDCLTLAEHLGLIVKDSSECLKDFGVEDFPLNMHYTKDSTQYTIMKIFDIVIIALQQ